MRLKQILGAAILLGAVSACAAPGARSEPTASAPTSLPPLTSAPPTASPNVADIIYTNANVITMDETNPGAQAVAIRGDTILAVGSNEGMAAYQGQGTVLVDLGGKTLVPGFIDAHQHRIGNRALLGIEDPEKVIQPAIAQGLTSIDELYVDQPRLEELTALDAAGVLRIRVDAYLPVMENSSEGRMLGDYYKAYAPGQVLSPHVRVAGLKIFTDYDNATILLWKQDALNQFVVARLQEGWPLAIKTVSTRSLEMILKAVEFAATIIPDIPSRRIRLEHMLFATPDQIARIKRLGLVPVINLNNPGQLVGDPDVDQLISREPQGSYTPWRNLAQAGVRFANATGWPSYYVDEPSGAPFGSPMHLIYQAVTRVGNLGTKPYPWLLDQTLTAAQAMRALTVDGAYASFEENTKGSLAPGKLADLVILSDDPLRVTPEAINNIRVLSTVIGGQVAWCSADSAPLCPGAAPVTTPAPAEAPFAGSWAAVDPADGSAMTLEVTHSGNGYAVVLADEAATACGLDASGKPKIASRVEASGTVHADVLTTNVTQVICLSDPPTSKAIQLTIEYTYQPGTDTLVDSSQGVVWHRR